MRLLWSAGLAIVLASGAGVTLALAAQTAQVARGAGIYFRRCAKCHGEEGEGKAGRPIIGPNANLGSYGSAQGIFDFTRKMMPIDAPGGLQEPEYWAVLAYLLSQNGILPPGTILGRHNAARIRLDANQVGQ